MWNWKEYVNGNQFLNEAKQRLNDMFIQVWHFFKMYLYKYSNDSFDCQLYLTNPVSDIYIYNTVVITILSLLNVDTFIYNIPRNVTGWRWVHFILVCFSIYKSRKAYLNLKKYYFKYPTVFVRGGGCNRALSNRIWLKSWLGMFSSYFNCSALLYVYATRKMIFLCVFFVEVFHVTV